MKLALGTVQFGLSYGIANQTGQITRREAKAMLKLALENDVDTLDTAIAYGDSEIRLGEIGTQGFRVVTKLPPMPEDCRDVSAWVNQQVSASFSRLGVTQVYGMLLHRPDQLLGPKGSMLFQSLQSLKENERVQKVGVSIYSPNELPALTSDFHFDLVQAPFNLVDRSLDSSGWLRRLREEDVEIHTRSAFLQGLLLMAQNDIPHKFSPWYGLWHRWHEWLSDYNGSAVQACLAFPLSFPEIDRVVVGADNVNQFAHIVSAAKDQPLIDLPDLQCEDENLINPSRWSTI